MKSIDLVTSIIKELLKELSLSPIEKAYTKNDFVFTRYIANNISTFLLTFITFGLLLINYFTNYKLFIISLLILIIISVFSNIIYKSFSKKLILNYLKSFKFAISHNKTLLVPILNIYKKWNEYKLSEKLILILFTPFIIVFLLLVIPIAFIIQIAIITIIVLLFFMSFNEVVGFWIPLLILNFSKFEYSNTIFSIIVFLIILVFDYIIIQFGRRRFNNKKIIVNKVYNSNYKKILNGLQLKKSTDEYIFYYNEKSKMTFILDKKTKVLTCLSVINYVTYIQSKDMEK